MRNHFFDQLNGRLTFILPFYRTEIKFSFLNTFQNLSVTFSIKWWVSTEKNIQNDSCWPHITFFIVISSEYFWGDVKWSSSFGFQNCSSFSLFLIVSIINGFLEDLSILLESSWKSKINDFQGERIILRNHDEVFRLQISMTDSIDVTVV